MRNRTFQTCILHIAGAVWLSIAMFACNSPARPSVTVTAGRPTSPAQNEAFSYYSQPITLVVTPGVTATGAPPTTVLEVATNGTFASIVVTQTLPPAVNGQSKATLDHLNAATTYYWRVKTTAGDNPSILSATSSFSIGPQLVIQAPTPVTPLADTFPHKRPTFTVTNASHTGPSATLTYRFDVASDAGFGTIVATGSVGEGTGQTSFVPSAELTPGGTYYWRAQASDAAKSVAGPFSTVQSFTTVNPDDGTYPYDLTLHIDSLTNCMAGGVPAPYYHPAPFAVYDSNLTVSANQLQFVWPVPHLLFPIVELDLQRNGTQLAGTFTFDGVTWPAATFPETDVNNSSLSGSTDSTGRLTGNVRGTWYSFGGPRLVGSPNDVTCDVQLGFVLTPQ